MFRRLVTGTALFVAVGIPAAGCGGSGSAEEGPEVAWAGGICDRLEQSGSKLELPESQSPEPIKAKEQMVGFLGDLSAQLGGLEKDLDKSGPPPVDGTRATYTKAMKRLGDTRKAVDDSVTALREAKVTDQASLNKALRKAGKGMSDYSKYPGPAGDLSADPGLKAAFEEAPSCSGIANAAPGTGTPGN